MWYDSGRWGSVGIVGNSSFLVSKTVLGPFLTQQTTLCLLPHQTVPPIFPHTTAFLISSLSPSPTTFSFHSYRPYTTFPTIPIQHSLPFHSFLTQMSPSYSFPFWTVVSFISSRHDQPSLPLSPSLHYRIPLIDIPSSNSHLTLNLRETWRPEIRRRPTKGEENGRMLTALVRESTGGGGGRRQRLMDAFECTCRNEYKEVFGFTQSFMI